MPDSQENNKYEGLVVMPSRNVLFLAVLLVLAVVATSASALVFALRERGHVRELAADQRQATAAVNQVRGQVEALSGKLEAWSVAPPQAQPAATRGSAAPRVQPRSAQKVRRPPAEDPRWNKLESRLSEQQKELRSTREEVEKARQDLQGKLSSTRDELSGSIAKTHEEVAALQRLGERNYHEFTLPKSKNFQRVGPLSLALRKTNFKRQCYELEIIVDDYKLKKRDVNLYEPVLIYLTDRPQPLEVVVNQVGKNQVRGYVSEPKYKKSELATRTTLASGGANPQP